MFGLIGDFSKCFTSEAPPPAWVVNRSWELMSGHGLRSLRPHWTPPRPWALPFSKENGGLTRRFWPSEGLAHSHSRKRALLCVAGCLAGAESHHPSGNFFVLGFFIYLFDIYFISRLFLPRHWERTLHGGQRGFGSRTPGSWPAATTTGRAPSGST